MCSRVPYHSWNPGLGPYGVKDYQEKIKNVCRHCGVEQRWLEGRIQKWYLSPLTDGGEPIWSTIRPQCKR
jgi:hypothetical protein